MIKESDTSKKNPSRIFALSVLKSLEEHDWDWKGYNPRLWFDGVAYFSDDTWNPSAYEWKVLCDKSDDCGSIIISVLDDTYSLLQASTNWKANYEYLLDISAHKKNKLYYFSPLEQYAESDDGNVTWINPTLNIEESKVKLKNNKQDYRIWKKSRIDKMQSIPDSYYSVTSIVTVPWNTTSACNSLVPCYKQNYIPSWACLTWCSPVAMSIIFGYYDRKWGTYANLIPNTASDTIVDQNMIMSVRTYMGTQCTWSGAGNTNLVSMKNWIQYAKDKWYWTSSAVLTSGASSMHLAIRTEINAWRPIMINVQKNMSEWHTMVWYAYTSSGITVRDVKVNFGWWPTRPGAYIPFTNDVSWTSNAVTITSPSELSGMKVTSLLSVKVQ